MTESEINEITDAIALCHHLCDGQPLSGRYYKLMNAVLPVLELEYNRLVKDATSSFSSVKYPLFDYEIRDCEIALDIARVINEKPVMNILDEKGKKDVKDSITVIEPGTKAPAKYTKKMVKSKDVKLHPEIVKRLEKEGRVIE